MNSSYRFFRIFSRNSFCIIVMLACTLFDIHAQKHFSNVQIVWNEVPDSITAISPLFEETGVCETFPIPCYFKEIASIRKNERSVVECVVFLYDTHWDFVSSSEHSFLTRYSDIIPDTLYYDVRERIVGDSSCFLLTLLPYKKTANGYMKLNKYSLKYRFDTVSPTIQKNYEKSATNSVLANGEWFKIAVNSTGIYKIKLSDFERSGVSVRGRNISDLAIFGLPGGALPEKNSDPRTDDLSELAISVEDENGNGLFDGNDYILFYGEAANVWRQNSTTGWFEYKIHPYSTENYYFFTYTTGIGNGKRIRTINESDSVATDVVNSYISCAVVNNDLTNTHNSGQIWVGEKFSAATTSRNFTLAVPEMIAGSNTHVRYAFASISTRNSSINLSWGNGSNTLYFRPTVTNYIVDENDTRSQGGNSMGFTASYRYEEGLATGYIDFIEINAESRLRFNSGKMDFRNFGTGTAGSVFRINIANANSNMKVWDVSDITDIGIVAGTLSNDTFSFKASNQNTREFVAFDGSSFLTPLRMSAVANQNLHALQSVDYIIVSHENYLQEAERLAQLHRLHNGLTVAVATPEQVFNEFSSGKQDAVAIRSLMKMLFDKSRTDATITAPKYLLLFGKASYDNRNLLGNNTNTIITYQSLTSFDDDGISYAGDDFFGYLHDSESGLTTESVEIGIGRLPASTLSEAQQMVDKIERYLTHADFDEPSINGDWRNSIVFLADDADPGSPGDIAFATSSEYTTDKIAERYPNLNINKIYADSYVQQSGAIGSFYPDAKNALTKSINNGCLLLNYVGHGSYDHIGSERYMERSDIDAYTNKYALPFFMASTCTFGKFDMTDELSGGEKFVLNPIGGGIGIVAASRPISHSREFDTKICMEALGSTNGTQNSIGDALKKARNAIITPHSLNLIGDPAIRLSIPNNNVVVTKINDRPVCDSIADTATVLSEVTIEGEIQDANGSLLTDFNGTLSATVFDRMGTYRTLANDNEDTEISFTQQKNILAKKSDTVINGRFKYTFTVPKDVAYKYDFGKLSHYAQSDSSNASGCYKNLLFGGFNEDALGQEFHPVVRLFMNDSLFISGGSTDNNPAIFAILSDKVGINSVGSGIGHDITAILDGNANEIMILNEFYETDNNDNTRGYITYPLYNLSEGTHTLTLKAWNVYNYSASATITFEVKNGEPKIGRFFAYPNPARENVHIHIEHNSSDMPTDADIYIFDASGRMLRSIKPSISDGSYVIGNVEWDFRNQSGAKVANGVYFMRAIVTFANGNQDTKSTKVIFKK